MVLAKLGGDEGGKVEEVGGKAMGCGEAGEVRKGTAAGLNGEENTGGPGGVLNWGAGLPSPGDSTFGVLPLDVEAICSVCNNGAGNLGPGEEDDGKWGGVLALFSGVTAILRSRSSSFLLYYSTRDKQSKG